MQTELRHSLVALFAAGTLCALCGCGVSPDPLPDLRLVQDLQIKASQSGDGAAATATASGWGTLTGKFVLEGNPPPPKHKDPNKDVEFCGKHTLLFEDLVVGPGSGLANVVVYLRKLPTEMHPDLAAAEGGTVVLDNKNCRFEPHVCLVSTKDALLVKNSDPVSHNTNYTGRQGFSESITPSGQLTKRFTKRSDPPASTTCNVHPWMDCWVLVLDHPYMAKSAEDGSFTIEKLPAGVDLEFVVWHERPSSKKIVASGTTPIKGGKLKIRIPQDGATVDLGTLSVSLADLTK